MGDEGCDLSQLLTNFDVAPRDAGNSPLAAARLSTAVDRGPAALGVRLATLRDDGPNGGFFDDSRVVAWYVVAEGAPAPAAPEPKPERAPRKARQRRERDPGDAVPPGVAVEEPAPLDEEAQAALEKLEELHEGE